MAKLLKLRRGTTSQHSSFTGAEGELTVDTTKDTAVVHDGSTAGGRPLLREDLNNMPASGVSAGTYGSSSAIPALTVDAKGRVTGATTSSIDSTAITNGSSNVTVNAGADIVFTRAGDEKARVDDDGIKFGDNKKVSFGADDDLRIFHDGSNSFINDNGTGGLYIRGANEIGFRDSQNSFNNFANFTSGGAVDLYYNGNKKFETTNTGVLVQGRYAFDTDNYIDCNNTSNTLEFVVGGASVAEFNSASLIFPDNKRARFGSSNDLQIYHDGSNSYINNATGNLFFQHGGENMAQFASDGNVELYYNNSRKFETTSTGASVTGTLTANTLEGDGVVPAGAILLWSGATNAIPSGYVLCNGSNSTPDLRNRFVVGAGTGSNYSISDTGGSNSTTLATGNLPSHTHSTGNHSHGVGNHSHNVNNHTHSVGNHSHNVNSHSHSTPNHNHNMNSHTHSTNNTGGHSHNRQFFPKENNYPNTNQPSREGTNSNGSNFSTGNAGNHSHNTNSGTSNTNSSGGGNTGNAGASTSTAGPGNTGNPNGAGPSTSNTGPGNTSAASAGTTGSTGSGTAVENRPPFYALCYIMKT